MLEHLIQDFNGKCNPIRMYSVEELSKATNDYKSDLIDMDWNFKLYKGVHEGQEILVKMFYRIRSNVDESVDLITNEVAIASNMSNHKNFLKLIGCCLETKLPTLVYEFPAKGNLSCHIYTESDHHIGLVWPTKLKIAIQVADAVAYLHYGTTKVIVHRDIKPGHIFLDQDYVAKLSEFQMSVPIPLGETHVDVDTITGTSGYLAPEYAVHGRTSEKTDVYNFGILLFVLFVGKRMSSLLVQNEGISNPGSPCSSNESGHWSVENRCKSYLEDNILEDENKKQVEECAKLVERCLQENPDERPIMTEVAQLLRSIKSL